MANILKKAINLSVRIKQQITQIQAKPSDFVRFLKYANAGMLDRGNIYCFEYVMEHLNSDLPIIEIGSFSGLSTNLIGYYLRKNNKTNKVITCDKWIFEGEEILDDYLEGSNIKHREYREFVKGSYMRNVSFFSKDNIPHTIEQYSDDFFKLWDAGKLETDIFGRQVQLGGKISFAYIDGNHYYDYAKRDFENVDKNLEIGGFILFDDSADTADKFEVWRVIDEIKKSGKYEIIKNNPNYLMKKLA